MSASVMHGRRKGQCRQSPTQCPPSGCGDGTKLTKCQRSAVGIDQMTVLSKCDWERIQYELNKKHILAEHCQQALCEKERLHEMSKETVKNWTNTLGGQRQMKLQIRQEREQQEEEARRHQDLEEAKYQAEQRREAIEKAKTKLYFQTDRLRGFHSALLLTEVLKERDAQIELKRLKEVGNTGHDKDSVEKLNRDHQEALMKEAEEARVRRDRLMETVAYQKTQAAERAREMDRQKEDELVEGEELRRLAAQHEQEMMKMAELKRAEGLRQKADNLQQQQDVKYMKEIERMQDEEEDDEIRVFATAKRKMMKMRADREKQMHDEKQANLEKIQNKLKEQLKAKVDDEDARIARAVEEKEIHRKKEEEEKLAKFRRSRDGINEHRIQQEKEAALRRAAEKEADIESLRARKEADLLFARNEAEKQRRRAEEAMAVTQFYTQQMDDRRLLEMTLRDQQLEQDRRNEQLLAAEEQQFQHYAKSVINDAERRGRNTLPLRHAAREGIGGGLGPVMPGRGPLRPSYMVTDDAGTQLSNYQRESTEEVKRAVEGEGDGGKRLGFVW